MLILKHLKGIDGVVQLIDTFEDEYAVHIIMELCPDGDLFNKVQAEIPYTEKVAAKITANILAALSAMHQLHVAHRDIKPENFLVAGDKIKFADFGLSSFFKPNQNFTDFVGSVNYMAPEVIGMPVKKGSSVCRTAYTTQADVWSVGVILYILLSGLPPFWGGNEQLYRQIRFDEIDYRSDPWPKISAGAKK